MALGFTKNATATENTYGEDVKGIRDLPVEKDVYGYDTEAQGVTGRKMARIGGPISGGIMGDSDSESAMSVNKQMELESTNSIKYRTCSWPKVN